MPIEPPVLSDGVATLTALRLADADAHLAGEDGELARWLSGGRSTRATVEAYVRDCVEQWRTGGPVRAFGIRGTGRDELAGTIEVQYDRAYLPDTWVNLSYGLYPAWRGQGLCTHSVRLASRYAASTGAAAVVIRVDPRNAPSARVAERAGFTLHRRADPYDTGSLHWYVQRLVTGGSGT